MDTSKICEMLNMELDGRPAFMRAVLGTLWAVDGAPEYIDVTPLGDDYCTNVLGIINGCLRASDSEYLLGTTTVNDSIVFIPIKIGVLDEEVPFTKET